MLRWEYVKIMNRNYLQTKKEQDSDDVFQYRMLLSETIKGLLPCKEREVNGVTYQLFDISSMQSLASIYTEKKLKFSDFYRLVYALKSTVTNMRTYLLDIEDMILYPEFIFCELDTGEINFLCCPGSNVGEADSVKKLYEFLLSSIDYDDVELTDLVYETGVEIEASALVVWINSLYEKLGKLQDERLDKLQDERLQETKRVSDESEDILLQHSEEIYCEESALQTQNTKLVDLKGPLIVCAVYIITVGVSVFYLYSNYILSTREHIFTVGAIVITTAVMAFWIFLWLKKKEHSDIRENPPGYRCSDDGYRGVQILPDGGTWEETEYGKTVYFEGEQLENKLYGMDKNNRIKIEINKFPFVIGKKAEIVDAIIDDASISRMHVRFEQKGDAVLICDLNSTNGTYKNGIMLAPHQKIEVFPGDEIWLGRLKYIYR